VYFSPGVERAPPLFEPFQGTGSRLLLTGSYKYYFNNLCLRIPGFYYVGDEVTIETWLKITKENVGRLMLTSGPFDNRVIVIIEQQNWLNGLVFKPLKAAIHLKMSLMTDSTLTPFANYGAEMDEFENSPVIALWLLPQ
jgi:hypothetical protein